MKMACLIAGCAALLLPGCAANTLVAELADRGVTPKTTAKLKFVSSEGDLGGDVQVTTHDAEVIDAVWTRVLSSKPTNHWVFSGWAKVEFYTGRKTEWPAATLLLNATDASHVETEFHAHYDAESNRMVGLMRCPGLHNLIRWHMVKEYDRRKENR